MRHFSFARANNGSNARSGSLDGSEGAGGCGDLLLAGLLELLGGAGLAGVLDVLVADVTLEADCSLAAAAAEGGLGLASVLALLGAGFRFAAVVIEGVRLLELVRQGAHLMGRDDTSAEGWGRRAANWRWSWIRRIAFWSHCVAVESREFGLGEIKSSANVAALSALAQRVIRSLNNAAGLSENLVIVHRLRFTGLGLDETVLSLGRNDLL